MTFYDFMKPKIPRFYGSSQLTGVSVCTSSSNINI